MFKEMDPELIKAILEEEEDVLTPLVEADQKLYDDTACPQCYGKTIPENDLRHLRVNKDGSEVVSVSDRPIPKKLCRCVDCGALVDPFSGIQLEMGNIGKIRPRIPIIQTK